MKNLVVFLCSVTLVFGLVLFAEQAHAVQLFYEDFDGSGLGFSAWTTDDANNDGLSWELLDDATRENRTPGS